jgi:Tfp pilus assembly protein PilZ
LPGTPEVLDAIAEVRWVRPTETREGEAGMGLQFVQMSAVTKQSVKAFVAKREAMVLADDDVT